MSRYLVARSLGGTLAVTAALVVVLALLLGQGGRESPEPLQIDGVSMKHLEDSGYSLTAPDQADPAVKEGAAIAIANEKSGLGIAERAVLGAMDVSEGPFKSDGRLVWVVVLDPNSGPPETGGDYLISTLAIVDATTGELLFAAREFGACSWGPEFAAECAKRGMMAPATPAN